jgi:putative nucleotidyltransferase with HDIG domain
VSLVIADFRNRVINLKPVDLFQYESEISEFKLFHSCEQSPEHHSEGNVLTHCNMAGQIVLHLLEAEEVPAEYKALVYLATLIHDIGKPSTSVFNQKKNKITAYGHDDAGVPLANEFMKKYFPEFNYKQREVVCRLIENHMHPRMWVKDQTASVIKMKMLSLAVNTKFLYILSQADTLGRIAKDMKSSMLLLEIFKQDCQDLGIWDRPYRVPLATHLDDASYSLARWNILMHKAPEDLDTYDAAQELMIQPPKPNFQLMLLIGAPGSGKSTIREQLVAQYPDLKVISMDDRRKELTGDTNDQSRNNEIFGWQQRELRKAMEARQNTVVDATNTSRKLRRILWDIGRENGALCSAIYFDLSLDTLLERNSKRERRVPDDVVKRFYNTMQSICPWECDQVTILDK